MDTTYANSYFAQRGVSEEVFRQFQLGHVAGAPGTLPKDITGAPAFPIYTIDGLFAGWIFRPGNKDYKYFYWSARPSEQLYGMPFSIDGILKNDAAIIVEGPFDVLMAHTGGQKNVVGVLGGVMSVTQILLLGSYTRNFILALDNDAAGLKGMNMSEELIKKVLPDVNISRQFVFPHKDFCEYMTAEIKNGKPKG